MIGIVFGIYDWILFRLSNGMIITVLFATLLCFSGLLMITGKLPVSFVILFACLLFTGVCFINQRWIFFPFKQQEKLFQAIQQGDTQTVKVLIPKIHLNAKLSPFEDTFLMCAIKEGKTEIVKILLEAGADVNNKDNLGRTALDIAETNENKEIIDLLKSVGTKE